MSATLLGKGTTLKLGSAALGGVISITGPNRQVGTVETTNLSSTVRTFRPTILDNGEVTVTIQFDPDDTDHTAVEALLTASPLAAASWVITCTDGTPSTYTFSGILTGLDYNMASSVDDLSTADLTIKISGAITKA